MKICICFIIIFCLQLLLACNGNEIYFNVDSKTINSCNNQVITNISIEDINGSYFSRILKLEASKGVMCIDLKHIDSGYYMLMANQKRKISEFSLMNNTMYKIRNSSNGDASGFNILIKTDEIGEIIYSNKLTCD